MDQVAGAVKIELLKKVRHVHDVDDSCESISIGTNAERKQI